MKFKLNDATYDAAENLTFGEEMDIAREFGDGDRAFLLGVVWVSVKRIHPKTRPEDLRDSVVEVIEDAEDALPPTSDAANGSDAASVPTPTA